MPILIVDMKIQHEKHHGLLTSCVFTNNYGEYGMMEKTKLTYK